MTEQILTAEEVLVKAANTFLVQQDDEIEIPEPIHSGRRIVRVRGRLVTDRPATVSVSVDDWGMLGVALNVPGGGGLGGLFRVLVEDATERRIDLHLEYMFAQHEMLSKKYTGPVNVV
jgi:hypothetical protein